MTRDELSPERASALIRLERAQKIAKSSKEILDDAWRDYGSAKGVIVFGGMDAMERNTALHELDKAVRNIAAASSNSSYSDNLVDELTFLYFYPKEENRSGVTE